MKKDGGTIRDWQIHHLSTPVEKAREVGYDIQMDECIIISGTVVNDPAGRWLPGYHMKSSIVCKLDRENGTFETQNSHYKLEGKEGGDVLPDLGDNISKIFY